MNILEMMTRDHDEALADCKRLSRKAESSVDDDLHVDRAALALSIRLHVRAEALALYTSCVRHGKELRDFALESYNEHALLEVMLERLESTGPGPDGGLRAILAVIEELIEHHGKVEEELEMFPRLRKAFDTEQLAEMGALMEAEKVHLREHLAPQLGQAATTP